VFAVGLTCAVGLPTVFLTSEVEPFQQAYEAFCDTLGKQFVGQIGNGVHDLKVVNVCMIQTLNRMFESDPETLALLAKQTNVVICDECHAYTGTMAEKVNDLWENANYILGISATPEPQNDRAIFPHALIGPVLQRVSYGKLIDAGVVCPITVFVDKIPKKEYYVPTNPYARKVQYRKIRKAYVYYNKDRNTKLAEFTKEMVKDNISVAIIVQEIQHAKHIQHYVPNAVLLTGKTPPKEREEIVRKLRNKEIMCVVTTIFNQAVNIPSLGAVAIMAGGKSFNRIIQRIRSTRTFSGKTARGHLTKKRGIVYYPFDECTMLTSHSDEAVDILRGLVYEHDANELIYV